MNANHYLTHQISQHESDMQSARSRLRSARTTLELVRALNHLPQAPAYLKCLAPVKSADAAFWLEAERKSERVLTDQVNHLKGLIGTESFCQESRRFQQNVRLLHHAVPRAARAALLALDGIRHAVEAQPLPDLSPAERPRA